MSSVRARKPVPAVSVSADDAVEGPIDSGAALRPVPVAGLVVGRADAPAERAADAIADTAMARLRRASRRAGDDGPQPRPHSGLSHLRRAWSPTPSTGGRVDAAGGVVDDATTSRIEAQRELGKRLPGTVQREMETAFGVSLNHVRVHNDAESASLSAALDAEAFTTGSDIFFGAGRFDPAVSSGAQVLAHEIAHVLAEPNGIRRPPVLTPEAARCGRENTLLAYRSNSDGLDQPTLDGDMAGHQPVSAAASVVRRLPSGTVPTPGSRYRYAVYVESGHRPALDDDGNQEFDQDGNAIQEFEQEYEHHVGIPTGVNADIWNFGTHAVDVDDVVEELPDQAGDAALLPVTRSILQLIDDLGMADIANAYGISVEQLLSVAIELDATPGADRANPAYMTHVLNEGESGPSCYNSATILYNLLATTPLTTTVQKAVGFEGAEIRPTARGNRTRLTATCKSLCDRIRLVVPHGPKCIFGVHFGGHGFTIVCDGLRVELLQSFAGASGDTLVNFLRGNVDKLQTYSVETIVGLLQNMIAEPTTLRAQSLLFGARADDFDLLDATFRWTCSDIRPTPEVMTALQNWITENLKYLARVRKVVVAAQASQPPKKRRKKVTK